MVEMFEQNQQFQENPSSKGNQLKWRNGDEWFKADYTGYEGLSEYVVSSLLAGCGLRESEYVGYRTEEIAYKTTVYLGCRCRDFLPDGWRLITLERLFKSRFDQSLYKSLYAIEDHVRRFQFLKDQSIRLTGLEDFGIYLSKLFTIDAVFLNEDRHMHNIAVLMDETGGFHYCPVFDNGAALLADTTMDYPLKRDGSGQVCNMEGWEVEDLVNRAEAKSFCRSFDEQLDIAERLCGQHLHFHFGYKDVEKIMKEEHFYSPEIKRRVSDILRYQMQKYQYLFS